MIILSNDLPPVPPQKIFVIRFGIEAAEGLGLVLELIRKVRKGLKTLLI